MDSKLTSNSAFFDSHIENNWEKYFWGHISTFCILINQMHSKKLKKLNL